MNEKMEGSVKIYRNGDELVFVIKDADTTVEKLLCGMFSVLQKKEVPDLEPPQEEYEEIPPEPIPDTIDGMTPSEYIAANKFNGFVELCVAVRDGRITDDAMNVCREFYQKNKKLNLESVDGFSIDRCKSFITSCYRFWPNIELSMMNAGYETVEDMLKTFDESAIRSAAKDLAEIIQNFFGL